MSGPYHDDRESWVNCQVIHLCLHLFFCINVWKNVCCCVVASMLCLVPRSLMCGCYGDVFGCSGSGRCSVVAWGLL